MRRHITIAAVLIATLFVIISPAGAVVGESFSFEFADEFTDRRNCDFPIEVSFVGSISGTEYLDNGGNLVRVQAHGEDVGTVTNPANGKSATGVDHWLEVTDVESGEFAVIGLFFHLNFGGAGIVLIDAGKVVFEADGDIKLLAGPHNALEGDFEALCAALA